ncbi:MAG: hypothetical protein P1U46_04905 [Patescibacteria group bacterium]|nr:hypothetical protein [Patescibacteria group bacterium]
MKFFQFCPILLFLYIIGHFGSSIFIAITIINIIGDSKTIQNIHAKKSKALLKIFAQLSRDVLFISITGILFIKERVVFVFVTSKEFVIYLYLNQKILVYSHKVDKSFFPKSLSIYKTSSHFLFSNIFFIFSIFQIYFIFIFSISFLLLYPIILYIFEFFMSSSICFIFFSSLLFIIKSFLFSKIHFFKSIYSKLFKNNLSKITKVVDIKNVNKIINLGISVS